MTVLDGSQRVERLNLDEQVDAGEVQAVDADDVCFRRCPRCFRIWSWFLSRVATAGARLHNCRASEIGVSRLEEA